MGRFILALMSVAAMAYAAKSLEVRFIDVEGGQATLIIAPSGQSMLVDTGYPGFDGRDADRIVREAKAAGLTKIDFVVVTHYHNDHVGGVPALAQRIPVGAFVDHGPNREKTPEADQLFAAYEKTFRRGKRLIVQPGDRIPIRGLVAEVVTAAGKVLPAPGAARPNAACMNAVGKEADASENAWSVGMIVSFGKFRLADLGDLTWNKELELVCPTSRIDPVDVYLTSHHGLAQSGSPALLAALHPRVAIMNNGATKGGSPAAWQIVKSSAGLEDLWQLHYSIEGGPAHNVAAEFIANPDEACKGKTIELSASLDGSFTVTNTRTGLRKKYPAKP